MAPGGGNKRITKEYTEIMAQPLPGMRVTMNETNIHEWEIILDGPEGSLYAGGHYKLHLTLPREYPFKPPVLSFQTKIYHPNVSNDDKGSMCLGILRSDTWKPPNKIAAVLSMARELLIEPNPDDAVETGIAEQYKNQRAEFERNVRDWVGRYASGKTGEGK